MLDQHALTERHRSAPRGGKGNWMASTIGDFDLIQRPLNSPSVSSRKDDEMYDKKDSIMNMGGLFGKRESKMHNSKRASTPSISNHRTPRSSPGKSNFSRKEIEKNITQSAVTVTQTQGRKDFQSLFLGHAGRISVLQMSKEFLLLVNLLLRPNRC